MNDSLILGIIIGLFLGLILARPKETRKIIQQISSYFKQWSGKEDKPK